MRKDLSSLCSRNLFGSRESSQLCVSHLHHSPIKQTCTKFHMVGWLSLYLLLGCTFGRCYYDVEISHPHLLCCSTVIQTCPVLPNQKPYNAVRSKLIQYCSHQQSRLHLSQLASLMLATCHRWRTTRLLTKAAEGCNQSGAQHAEQME